MPVRESALQKLFDEAMSEDYRIGGNINSFIYEVTTVSQEDIDGVRYLIDHAKGGSAAGNAVSRIIEEEVSLFRRTEERGRCDGTYSKSGAVICG